MNPVETHCMRLLRLDYTWLNWVGSAETHAMRLYLVVQWSELISKSNNIILIIKDYSYNILHPGPQRFLLVIMCYPALLK